MESTLKRMFHRRGHSSQAGVEPPPSPSSIQTSPYHHTKPGQPPTQGGSPLHGHSRSPSSASQATKVSRGRDTHRRSLSLRKKPPPPDSSTSSNNLPVASVSPPQANHSPVQQPALPTPPESIMPRHVGQTTNTTTTTTTTGPPPGTAITSDNATYLDSPINTNGSLGLEHITLGGDKHLMTRPSRRRYSEDIAERNMHNQYEDSGAVPVVPDDSHSEDVATRNMSESQPSSINPVQEKAETAKEQSHVADENESSGAVLPVGGPKLRDADGAVVESMNMDGAPRETRPAIPGSFPSDEGHSYAVSSVAPKAGDTSSPKAVPSSAANGAPTRSYLVQDAAEKPSLEGVVDLRNTHDTSYHERYAPAVTHETIYPQTHDIREERIFREIHTHDIHHRILPIVDVEVLPARHFLPDPRSPTGLTEVPESAVPGRSAALQNWVVAETVSRLPKQGPLPTAPRAFTARRWEGADGDERTYVTEGGWKRTETTWIHPPRLETGARESGQSEPFYFSSPTRVAAKKMGGKEGGVGVGGVKDVFVRDDGEGLQMVGGSEGGRLRDLVAGVRDAPFEECVAFEEKLKRDESAFL
ncbi:hypothetical protein K490DRAFT_68764 [Saccharata proteae CBS 121410]|uniref:Uncharacterized protein n=1 Tax=Saccharata proteae CBS 121410 TaxID=1314787 RepID=A0A9P4HRV5_9PEZI|nr:hypothetical protein K490DRAFT_68764 [Saccharata proteae CBS 121410]